MFSVLYGFLLAVPDASVCGSVRQTPLQQGPLNFPASSFLQWVGEVAAVIASAAWSPPLPHAAELSPAWPVLYDTRDKIALLGKTQFCVFKQ